MEIGNAVFGNSRGEYPVPRGEGWEEELYRLFDAYAPERDNSWREYGVEFENDTFSVMPYYWGECECGYDEKEAEWLDSHEHAPDCYARELEKIDIGVCIDKEIFGKFLEEKLKPLYERYGWDTSGEDWWHGYVCRCSCDYEKQWEEFVENNGHEPFCRLVRLNFHYKPLDFQIQWYKYPLRDSYMNQPLTLEQFREIIDDCIKSLGGGEAR